MTEQIYTPLYWTGKWLDRMSLCNAMLRSLYLSLTDN
jgi:hypothetical protein